MGIERYFNAYDAVKSYNWLGHDGHGYTELLAIHPLYKPGKEYYEENVQNKAFPRVWYAKDERELLSFLNRYHGSHMCCYGVNPRAEILRNDKNYPRRAGESDIAEVQNFYLDFDYADEIKDGKQAKTLEDFLDEVDSYLLENKFNRPVRAFSGKGYHLLFALPTIQVSEHEDISDRLNAFWQKLHDKYASDTESLGIKMDKTTDLARVAKIYGTKKPGSYDISRFTGDQRIEDNSLLEYLLSLPIEQSKLPKGSQSKGLPITTYDSLPMEFSKMIENNLEIARLWEGTGKNSGDSSRSGYDMSLLHACIKQGITDPRDLATILALRDNGGVKSSGKGDDYIRVTVMKALQNSAW